MQIEFDPDKRDKTLTLRGRRVIVVWTPRGEVRRIISMRKANEREIARFAQALG